jgi:hypothetical protein
MTVLTEQEFKELAVKDSCRADSLVAKALGYLYICENNEESYWAKDGIIYKPEDMTYFCNEDAGLREMLEWIRNNGCYQIILNKTCFIYKFIEKNGGQTNGLWRRLSEDKDLNMCCAIAILRHEGRIE